MVDVKSGVKVLSRYFHDAYSSLNDSLSGSRAPYFDEYAFHRLMYERRLELLNKSTAIRFGLIYSHFEAEAEDARPKGWLATANESAKYDYLQLFSPDANRTDIISGDMCGALTAFRETGGMKPHVYIGSEWGDNWGSFSTPIPNRTVDWGGWLGHWNSAGCDLEDLWYYLNHANLSAIVTTQHQWLDHPKVISVPLGQQSGAAETLQMKPFLNRSNLFLISNSESDTRTPIHQRIIANFNGTIRNRKGDGSDYHKNIMSTKFILAPSGLGLDCYRNWEAMILGAIPVIETLGRRDGLFRAYHGLPILLVDHFDNVTPSLLEKEYPGIVAKGEQYAFERLTLKYWIKLVNSYRVNPPQREISL